MNLGNIVGNLIIAPPIVKGTFWYKTVIMLVEHYNYGSIGIVLNKKSNMTINELGEKLGLDIDVPGFVYNGGPISSNSISLLHSNEWSCSNTLRLNDNFSLSSSKDMLPRLAIGDYPKKWRLFYGMCGWATNQLESEIQGIKPYTHENSWCIASSNPELVFEYDLKMQWTNALEQSAEDFAKSIDFKSKV